MELPSGYVQWVLSFSVCALIYAATLVWYRLTLHPLAKYPGPLLGKATSFYATYHAFQGDMHLDLERCHEKYGTFVRYKPNSLAVNTAEGFQDIYGPSKKIKKAESYLLHGSGNMIGVRDKKYFTRLKKIFSQGFSDAAIREHEPKVLHQINAFCENVMLDDSSEKKSSDWSTAKNMSSWSNYLTTDIITNVIFTSTWELLTTAKNRGFSRTISAVLQLTGAGHQSRWIYRYKLAPLILPTLAWSLFSLRRYTIMIMDASMKVRKDDPDVKDVFGLFVHAKDTETGKELAHETVVLNASTLIIAGSDTSSTVLAAAFFYLTQHPEAYELVAQEVRAAFPSPASIRSGPELNNCKYLRAALNEAMRLSPPAAQPLWREVESDGCMIDGRLIPAGANVGTGLYNLHHNPVAFPDPYTYDILRWVVRDENSEEEAHLMRERHRYFAPFSTGPRTCLAKNFALMELLLTMAHVFVRLDFERADGKAGDIGRGGKGNGWGRQRTQEFQFKSYFTSHVDGPMIRFKKREVDG